MLYLVKQQQSTNDKRQTTTNNQPPTKNQQPTSNNQQPTVNSQQPTANSQHPQPQPQQQQQQQQPQQPQQPQPYNSNLAWCRHWHADLVPLVPPQKPARPVQKATWRATAKMLRCSNSAGWPTCSTKLCEHLSSHRVPMGPLNFIILNIKVFILGFNNFGSSQPQNLGLSQKRGCLHNS